MGCQDWEQENFGVRTAHQADQLLARYSTVQYSTVQYSIVQYSSVQLLARVAPDAPRLQKRRHRFSRRHQEGGEAEGGQQRISGAGAGAGLKLRSRGRAGAGLRRRGPSHAPAPVAAALVKTKPSFAEFKQSLLETSAETTLNNIGRTAPEHEKVTFYYFGKLLIECGRRLPFTSHITGRDSRLAAAHREIRGRSPPGHTSCQGCRHPGTETRGQAEADTPQQ